MIFLKSESDEQCICSIIFCFYWSNLFTFSLFLQLVCTIVGCPILIFMFLIPESPRWQFAKGKDRQGRRVRTYHYFSQNYELQHYLVYVEFSKLRKLWKKYCKRSEKCWKKNSNTKAAITMNCLFSYIVTVEWKNTFYETEFLRLQFVTKPTFQWLGSGVSSDVKCM